MIELCNALKFITILIFIQNILTFNLGVVFLKSVSIYYMYIGIYFQVWKTLTSVSFVATNLSPPHLLGAT